MSRSCIPGLSGTCCIQQHWRVATNVSQLDIQDSGSQVTPTVNYHVQQHCREPTTRMMATLIMHVAIAYCKSMRNDRTVSRCSQHRANGFLCHRCATTSCSKQGGLDVVIVRTQWWIALAVCRKYMHHLAAATPLNKHRVHFNHDNHQYFSVPPSSTNHIFSSSDPL
jgi:hypothetical protein